MFYKITYSFFFIKKKTENTTKIFMKALKYRLEIGIFIIIFSKQNRGTKVERD